MTKKSETIVFFGSGPVAGQSLEFLARHFIIEAVITKPRPPHHRGDVPVIRIAQNLNLPIFTADNKQQLSHLMSRNKFASLLGVLVDFGIIVNQDVIESFKLGIINSHFSLLPRWRGADPISFAILKGDTKTGVSLMLIDQGMDTGKILTQRSMPIPDNINTPALTTELIQLSNNLLLSNIPLYINGKLKPRQQPHPDRATYSRKLTKKDGLIVWQKPAEEISREIRAFLSWPSSRTNLLNRDVIITEANIKPSNPTTPGLVEVNKKQGTITVHTGSNLLNITRLKPLGKREMSAKEFISGYYKA